MRLEEEQSDLLVTNCGHGDCKPSNVLLHSRQDNAMTTTTMRRRRELCFLDLELTGIHFAAFDLGQAMAIFGATNVSIKTNETYLSVCGCMRRGKRER